MNEEILVSVVDEKGNCELIDDFGNHNLSHGKWIIDDTDGIDVYEFNNIYKCFKDSIGENKDFDENLFGKQIHYTPENIIDKMIDCVDIVKGDNILVLYNEEIVERLVKHYKYPAENITFVTDSLFRMMRLHVNNIHCKTIYVKNYTEIEKEIKDMNFDYVISNPPYDDNVDLKIASAVLPHCKKGVFIHPSIWILQNKPSKKFNYFNDKFADKISKITFKWCNGIFKIKIFYPCSITHFDMSKSNSEIEVDDSDVIGKENHVYTAKNLKDITWYGEDFYKYEMKKFFERITGYSPISQHNSQQGEFTDYSVKFALCIGNHSDHGNKPDFFSLLSLDVDKNNICDKNFKLSKSDNDHTNNGKKFPIWSFDTEEERENFITYLKSKFARFCLSYYKCNANIYCGELESIPWLDFKKHWNDKTLKEYFNISNELYDYIDHFIPDYYSDYKFDM